MDNQDNKKLAQLEALYNLLVSNPDTGVNELSLLLKLTPETILQLLSKLITMGLDIYIKRDTIRLKNKVDCLDSDLIVSTIKKVGIKKPIHYSFSIASTNEQAAKDKNQAIYICNHQSAGVGRQSKSWLTPLGQSIAISISHDFKFGLGQLSGLNIAIGVALINTIKKCGYNHLSLKWPNDIFGQDGKVAGILIEASGNNSKCRAIIGIGLNWQIQQSLLASIEQKCMNIDIQGYTRTEFISKLIIEIEQVVCEFSQNKLTNIKSQWDKHDAFINQNINIIYKNKIDRARYIGINQQGLLTVKLNNEMKTLASSEVSIILPG